MPRQNYHHGDLKNALIQAGIDILADEGLPALTLRKVAARAGVSHSAPYAHFVDKQDLVAAISTRGMQLIQERLQAALEQNAADPAALLQATAWAYVSFALDEPAYFNVIFSGVLEYEKQYPDFVEISHRNFQQVVALVEHCQAAGLLRPGPADVLAVSIWSLVHGFTALLLERQIPHQVLQRSDIQDLLRQTLRQVTVNPAAG